MVLGAASLTAFLAFFASIVGHKARHKMTSRVIETMQNEWERCEGMTDNFNDIVEIEVLTQFNGQIFSGQLDYKRSEGPDGTGVGPNERKIDPQILKCIN